MKAASIGQRLQRQFVPLLTPILRLHICIRAAFLPATRHVVAPTRVSSFIILMAARRKVPAVKNNGFIRNTAHIVSRAIITTRRVWLAILVAVVADGLQFLLGPFGAGCCWMAPLTLPP